MNIPLTGLDVKKQFDNKVKIVLYCDLDQFENINELLRPYDLVFILYEFKRFYGHWTVLYKYEGQIYFFDSYGTIPDDELAQIDYNFRVINNMVFPHLTYLLAMGDVNYNEFKYQKMGDGIATCGRWCVYRYQNRHLSTDGFHDLIKRQKKLSKKLGYKMTNDELVTLMVPIK